MAKVAIMGHGVVGSGVAHILRSNASLIARHAGEPVELTRILDLRDFADLPYADLFTKDSADVVDNPQIDIVVECMGGVEPAATFIERALKNHKHVVTSNKELVVVRGTRLTAIAQENGVNFMYEASVGGGIPIIRPLRQCLAANHIQRIAGILNGTTNYILTRMRDGGVDFDVALAEAQKLGYAEKDPSADVLGWDARRKICILSHVAFGAPLDDSKIPSEGIDKLTRADMLYAKELGRAVKLLAVSQRVEAGYYAYVGPAMIPAGHPLSVVDDVFNAVFVTADMLGDAMFYGRGAGKLPTASAICGDVVDVVWHKNGVKAAEAYQDQADALDAGTAVTRLFVRVKGEENGPEEQLVQKQLGDVRIVRLLRFPDEFAFITGEEPFDALQKKIDALAGQLEIRQRLRYDF